ncbi:MAG: class I SAM-dependent methyltransferase [Ferruginibacter sp.]
MDITKKDPGDWTPENIANFWNWQSKNAFRQSQYFTASMAPGIVRVLKNKGLLKGSVLDYGCGAGHLLEEMVKIEEVDFYGLDFSADSITATQKRTANKKNLKQLVLANTLPCSFNDSQFDTITLIETIEHLQDDQLQETLNELHRILKTKGKVFITTPFNEDLDSHMNFCPFCKSEFHHMQHMQSFDIARLTALAKQHGFVVDYCRNINMEKFRIGAIKFYIKNILKKTAISLGLKEKEAVKNPNLIAFFSKP